MEELDTIKEVLKTNDSMRMSLTYPDPVVTNNVIVNSLANVNIHLDALVKRVAG